jgi:hypothetical protein
MLKEGIAGGVGGVQFNCPDKEGYDGYLASGWQDLSDQLFAAASDVQQALSQPLSTVADSKATEATVAAK